jgi:hypothetical protein
VDNIPIPPRRVLAHHEAGHAVVGIMLRGVLEKVHMPLSGINCHCRWRKLSENSVRSEQAAIAAIAGPCAEVMLSGKPRTQMFVGTEENMPFVWRPDYRMALPWASRSGQFCAETMEAIAVEANRLISRHRVLYKDLAAQFMTEQEQWACEEIRTLVKRHYPAHKFRYPCP